MMDAGRHPLIELLTCAELVGFAGEPGAFRARLRLTPRYVDASACTGCRVCVEKCPWRRIPSEFDAGMGPRPAIYIPFPQAVPNVPVIDPRHCVRLLRGPGKCELCARVCEPKAIRFDQQEQVVEIEVASVVVATGFAEADPSALGAYGYRRYPDVITSLELARLMSASGPSGGHLKRPSDGAVPRRVVFVQCVGSRGEAGRSYCSRYCCTNSVKDAQLARQHEKTIESIAILYTDLRAFGKGHEEFLTRARSDAALQFIRGRPGKIVKEGEELAVYVEDTEAGRALRLGADLVVLASAAVPSRGAGELAGILGIELDENGFFAHREERPLESSREGIYLAGGAAGPFLIPESVAQACGAALKAARLAPEIRVEPSAVEPLEVSGPPRVGVFVCHCGVNIAGVVDVKALVGYAAELPQVAYAAHEIFACSDDAGRRIQAAIRERRLNRLVVAACSPRTHEPVFRAVAERSGLNPYLVEMVNIRDQCSWVHAAEPALALEKAKDLLRAGVARAARLAPLHSLDVPVDRSVVVIGGGIAGLESALELAESGYRVTLLEKDERLGGRLASNKGIHLYPEGKPASLLIEERVRLLSEKGVEVLTSAELKGVSGFVGNFDLRVESRGAEKSLRAGALVLASGAELYRPKGDFGYGRLANVYTSLEWEKLLAGNGERLCGLRSVAFIQCVGSRGPKGNPGCSRYCCPTTVKQALALRGKGIEAAVFYRDLRMVGPGAEALYRKARAAGVLFSRFDPPEEPCVVSDGGGGKAAFIESRDVLLGQPIELAVDAVVLAVGLVPKEPDASLLATLLKLPRSEDGFFMERQAALGPVESTSRGVFLCGTVLGPREVLESMAQASAAAAKAASLLSRPSVKLEPSVAVVDPELCRSCGTCVEVCSFHAPSLVERNGTIVSSINPALCQGCGTCAVWCPTGAIEPQHFTRSQILASLDALLMEEVARS